MTGRGRSGFTLLDTMIALVVLAVGIVGIFAALGTSARQSKEGQIRQTKMALLSSAFQRLALMNKWTMGAGAVAAPATAPEKLAVGAAPWAPDPSPPVAGDLSSGAYFTIEPQGKIAAAAVAPGTPCGSAAIPLNVYCREMAIVRGMPNAMGSDAGLTGAVPSGAQPYTVWLRVSRRGEPVSDAVVHRELVIQ